MTISESVIAIDSFVFVGLILKFPRVVVMHSGALYYNPLFIHRVFSYFIFPNIIAKSEGTREQK